MSLSRAKNICLTTALFQKEVKELRSMFQENGYPKSYFDKIFKRFLTEQDAKEKTIPDDTECALTSIRIATFFTKSFYKDDDLNKI